MWRLKVCEGGRWLMSVNNHIGRQHWEFDPDAGTPKERSEVDRLCHRFTSDRLINKQSSDLLMRMQMRKGNKPRRPIPAAVKVEGVEDVTEEAVETTLRRGIDYLCSIQAHDGHWPSEFAGPLFFMPPLVMALYITGGLNTVFPSAHQKEIKRYIYNHQNEDGGWGLHIEGPSTMFGSTLNYIALRLVGEGPDHDAILRGRKWILDHGGAVGIPSWGKFWLAVLGVYEWDGCNPLPPELWLLPKVSPLPGKMLCYCRMVYMPMSYLYGKRFVGEITPLVQQLRQELYVQRYHHINWNAARTTVAKEDTNNKHPLIQDMLWGVLYNVVEPALKVWPFSKLREKAVQIAMKHIHYEDINSQYIGIGCIPKILCTIACWVEDQNSEAYKFHLARIPDYLWVAEDGMKLQGTVGSQTWEATFAIQAIMSSNLTQEYAQTLRKAHDFVKASQVEENPSGNYKQMYRHSSKGSWTFCTQDSGWQVSDCTAEGLKVALLYSQMPGELVGEKTKMEQLYNAVDVILAHQSKNGGFPAWEPQRTYRWLEKLNPTEIFEDCFIETEHVECTSSIIQALALFEKLYPGYRRQEIETCIQSALLYILDQQNSDGSWNGNWGICFTYGTWFAVDALTTCTGMNNKNRFSDALQKACEFLLSKQLPDGGWGESYRSSTDKVYTNMEGDKSNLVQTSWALLALMKAGQVAIDPTPIKKAIKLLINSQVDEDGDFPQQETIGSFFNACILNYATYRNIFPILALGEYRKCVQLA